MSSEFCNNETWHDITQYEASTWHKQMQKASLPPSTSELFILLPVPWATAFGDLDPMIMPAVNEKNYPPFPRHLPFQVILGMVYKVKNQNITPWMQGSVCWPGTAGRCSAVWVCRCHPSPVIRLAFWVKNDNTWNFSEKSIYLSLQGLPWKHHHFLIDVYLI